MHISYAHIDVAELPICTFAAKQLKSDIFQQSLAVKIMIWQLLILLHFRPILHWILDLALWFN